MSVINLPVVPRAGPRVERRHISYSAISTYATCPLRFKFRYLDCLPEETVGSSLVFGHGVHRACQHSYEQLLAGRPAPSLDVLPEVFWESWHDHEDQQILFGRGEDINTIGLLAERVLRAFLASDLVRPTGNVIGIEEELRGELVPGLPELLARVARNQPACSVET